MPVMQFLGKWLLVGMLLCSAATASAGQAGAAEPLPQTLPEAVAQIISRLSEKDKETLRSTAKQDLISYHFSLGRNIRNSFSLWGGNDALLRAACKGEPCQPDDASMYIIEQVWETLRHEKQTP